MSNDAVKWEPFSFLIADATTEQLTNVRVMLQWLNNWSPLSDVNIKTLHGHQTVRGMRAMLPSEETGELQECWCDTVILEPRARTP